MKTRTQNIRRRNSRVLRLEILSRREMMLGSLVTYDEIENSVAAWNESDRIGTKALEAL